MFEVALCRGHDSYPLELLPKDRTAFIYVDFRVTGLLQTQIPNLMLVKVN
jgi:hypothetical protein